MGVESHRDLTPSHLRRRISQLDVRPLSALVPWVSEGSYLEGVIPEIWRLEFEVASARTFRLGVLDARLLRVN
jgi:hypothetical protein